MKRLFLSSMIVAIGMIATALMTSCEKKEDPIAVTGVQLSKNHIVIVEAGTATLTATILPENAENKSVTWASSNTEIATIDPNGLVTAIKEGTATITATTQDGGKTATCIVNVEPAIPYITMVTQKNIGEDIKLIIGVANDDDKAGVWIDLNNNSKKDIDEDKIVFYDGEDRGFFDDYPLYRLQSQTVTLYGKVISLDCYSNQLTQLDVSKNTQLKDLSCGGNQLTQLDVSKNTQLKDLSCGGNQLTQLDVSKNTQLKDLSCGGNQLTQLDVSKNTQLTNLDCRGNQLTQLDVSKNTQLTDLDCYNNQLTQLDVSKNSRLNVLTCVNNRLTQLNVSKNTQLALLYCNNNQLTQLDISQSKQLIKLYCFSNQLTKEAMNKLIDDLPPVRSDYNRMKEAYLVYNGYGVVDGNYQSITDEQKQKAKDKKWKLYVDSRCINP